MPTGPTYVFQLASSGMQRALGCSVPIAVGIPPGMRRDVKKDSVPLPKTQITPAIVAPRPATVARKKNKIRLLVPCGDQLPKGVLARLKQSPVDVVVVHPTLNQILLRRSDVVLLGDAKRIGELSMALKRMDAMKTPVVSIGGAGGADYGLQVTRLEQRPSAEATADAVLKTVVRLLKPLGKTKPEPTLEAAGLKPEPAANDQTVPSEGPACVEYSGADGGENSSVEASAAPPSPVESLVPKLPSPHALPSFVIEPPRQHPPKGTTTLALGSDPASSDQVSRSLLPASFSIQGSRWVVLDDDVARAHTTASCLSDQGAHVQVTGTAPNEERLAALRAFDAVGVLVPETLLEDLSPLLRTFHGDARLCWVRVVPVRYSELYNERTSRIDEEGLKLLLMPHWQVEHDTARDLLTSRTVPLDHVGPAKLLRAAARLRGKMDFSTQSAGRAFRVTLCDGQVLAIENDGVKAGENAAAVLALLLAQRSGSAILERNRTVSEAKPLAPVDALLDGAVQHLDARVASQQATKEWRGHEHLETPIPRREPAPALPPETTVTAPEPDPSYGEDLLTVPLMNRAELTGSSNGGTSNAERSGFRVKGHFWEASRILRDGLRWAMPNLVVPATRAVLDLTQRAWPWVSQHRKVLYVGAPIAAVCLALTVALVATDADDAKATSDTLPSETPTLVASAPAVGAMPQPVTPVVPDDTPPEADEPETPKLGPGDGQSLESWLAKPAPRPKGCEKWVGSEPGPRNTKQATSAWHMARKSLMRGDIEQAAERLCLSMHLDVTGPGTLDLVRHVFARGDVDSALAWARWAVTQRPGDPTAEQLLADAAHQSGDENLARALLLHSMKVTANEVQLLESVANKFSNGGYRALEGTDAAQADRLFRRASALDPSHANAMAGRSIISLRDGDVESALRFARKAVELDPRSFEAQLALGDAQSKKGSTAEAKTAWLTAAALRPSAWEPRARLRL